MRLSHKSRARHARRVAARQGTVIALTPPFTTGQEVKLVSGAPVRYLNTLAEVLSVDPHGRKLTLRVKRRQSPLEVSFADVRQAA